MSHCNILTKLAAAALLSTLLFTAPAALAQTAEKPYTYVEKMPVFKGGESEMIKFLGSNIQYPKEAREVGLEGIVVISFVVGTDGSISDIQTLKELGKGTEEEAKRVAKLMDGKWTPGSQAGKLVPVRYTLPIRFALSEADRAAMKDIANQMPQFKGGHEAMLQTMGKHLQLPVEARQENLQAQVMVRFTVEPDGTVSDIKLKQTKLKKTIGPGSDLDYMDANTFGFQNKAVLAQLSEAAVAAVKATSGHWNPALRSGQAKAAEITLPVRFIDANAPASATAPAMLPIDQKILPDPNKVYSEKNLDTKPSYKEGKKELIKLLAKNIRYPDTQAEGDVKINFIVSPKGGIGFYVNLDEKNELLAKEVTRVLQITTGKWNPGRVDGKPVSSVATLNVRFVIDDGQEKPAAKTINKLDAMVTKEGVVAPAAAPDVVVTKYR
ncbi:TonB family protein [Pontibacter diazotrophicus]|uniref:TonB family protein n=1 Tax=Pontibacter diazotrophicus TaxID=1400979 RepID=UPI0015F15B00|nr:TonB family protein [Pontibacter diazotrophicus]